MVAPGLGAGCPPTSAQAPPPYAGAAPPPRPQQRRGGLVPTARLRTAARQSVTAVDRSTGPGVSIDGAMRSAEACEDLAVAPPDPDHAREAQAEARGTHGSGRKRADATSRWASAAGARAAAPGIKRGGSNADTHDRNRQAGLSGPGFEMNPVMIPHAPFGPQDADPDGLGPGLHGAFAFSWGHETTTGHPDLVPPDRDRHPLRRPPPHPTRRAESASERRRTPGPPPIPGRLTGPTQATKPPPTPSAPNSCAFEPEEGSQSATLGVRSPSRWRGP